MHEIVENETKLKKIMKASKQRSICAKHET